MARTKCLIPCFSSFSPECQYHFIPFRGISCRSASERGISFILIWEADENAFIFWCKSCILSKSCKSVVRVTVPENSCIPVRYMYRRQFTGCDPELKVHISSHLVIFVDRDKLKSSAKIEADRNVVRNFLMRFKKKVCLMMFFHQINRILFYLSPPPRLYMKSMGPVYTIREQAGNGPSRRHI